VGRELVKRVLVVNDSKFERNIMRDLLINLGYGVETTDEYSILSHLESYDPDMVIANMNMANITGDVLIKEIKGEKPSTKCYLSSCSDINPEYSQSRWIDGFIKTPVSIGQLFAVLEKEDIEVQKLLEVPVHQGHLEAIKEPQADGRHPDNFNDKNVVLRFCPYCGDKLKDTSGKIIFCPFCGTKL
jgi:response regulator RpfG family c-di-GMP phosphodiesterase